MRKSRTFVAGPDDSGKRLDRVLRKFLPSLGLSAIYTSLRKGLIRIDARRASPDLRVVEGSSISIADALLDGAVRERNPATAAAPAALADLIVLETEDLLFLDKPRGMLTHGEGGLDLLVAARLAARSGDSLSFTPGPLHRLDRNTSGLVTFPKTARGARVFSAMLREGGVAKAYLALLSGSFSGDRTWRDRLLRDGERRVSSVSPASADSGVEAESRAVALLTGREESLALILLATGRTHQIRTQAAARGHPLAGDLKYGGGPRAGGYFLHAWELAFAHRPFDDTPLRVRAPLGQAQRGRLIENFGEEALESALSLAETFVSTAQESIAGGGNV